MKLNQTVTGTIVIFVLFGRCSADSVEDRATDDDVSPEQTEDQSESLPSFFQIKTYLDVVNGTFFKTNTQKDVGETQDPERLQNKYDSIMKDLEKTYGKFAYTHLHSLKFALDKAMSSKFGFLMPIVFKDDAVGVFTKCKLSFENNRYELPEWLKNYLAFLNGIEFEQDVHGNSRIAVTPQFEEKIDEIEKSLTSVTDDFPKTKRNISLTEKRAQQYLFTPHLPWMHLNNLIVSFKGVYGESKCTTKVDELIESAPGVFDECQTISYFYQVVFDLMQLQIILDVNSKTLPYVEDYSGAGSGRGKFQVWQADRYSGTKLMDSFDKIKTYQDVLRGTLFLPSTGNDTDAPDGLESRFADKMENVERTYALYAFRHLEFLVYIIGKNISSLHVAPMTLNLRTNAVEVLQKCKFTFTTNGLPVPEWLDTYLELLNAVEFRKVDGIKHRISVSGPFLKALVAINELFAGMFDGYPIVYVTSNPGEKEFRAEILPWNVLHAFNDLYWRMYVSSSCEAKTYDPKEDRAKLATCAGINYYHRVTYNLMEFQIILDVNRKQLPYYG